MRYNRERLDQGLPCDKIIKTFVCQMFLNLNEWKLTTYVGPPRPRCVVKVPQPVESQANASFQIKWKVV